MNILTPAERLIVAFDFKPPDEIRKKGNPACRTWMGQEVLGLAKKLKGTGIIAKVNSSLRALGYELIDEIHSFGLKVFADLKLYDIGETLSTDGVYLNEAKPELLTVVCTAGLSAMDALKAELPDTEVLGVTVLTSIKEVECARIFPGLTLQEAVQRMALLAGDAGMGGIICAPGDMAAVDIAWSGNEAYSRMTKNTPNIRPAWANVVGDDQNSKRGMTPAEAIKAGAHRIVIGRPIVKAEDPYDAAMRTIDEIASATS